MYFRPYSLLSGPESGLGNELWTLAGWLLLTKLHNATLCLPPFTSNVHRENTSLVPFGDIFNSTFFMHEMSKVNINIQKNCRGQKHIASTKGWRHYKKKFARQRALNNGTHPHQYIVWKMYRSLKLSTSMARVVKYVTRKIGITSPYACIHARVEPDILHVAKHIPSLSDYNQVAKHFNKSVFWASSNKLNVTGFQAPFKLGFDTQATYKNTRFDYLKTSLVDFSICRDAEDFAGMYASSFSRILAEDRSQRGLGWISTCRNSWRYFDQKEVTTLFRNWSLCPNHKEYTMTSFGWSN